MGNHLAVFQQKADLMQATEISSHLPGGISKAHASRILGELHQNKKIEGRIAGKQVVYHALQEASSETMPVVLVALDAKIEQLQGQVISFQSTVKKSRAELTILCAKPLLSELRCDISQIEQQHETTRARLERAHERDSKPVPAEIKTNGNEDWKLWRTHAVMRSRICHDLWRECSEVVPNDMSRVELWVRDLSTCLYSYTEVDT
ncbi:hypothetical protein BO71DRAFT_323689 [Aspergillus ellipticus CBS 707.79]|uniref:Uncharacterized protein n=1 Tax=Aspergillus ellipticus CBS 707.79 TaxID=1448320 RepID=A0A319DMA1_9EURO|nr:hypothetical protein BO71DRAFT_323689 [Aspergillus ellipticus CBS 707.79]